MEKTDYTKNIPLTPPDGMKEWIRSKLIKNEYIIYGLSDNTDIDPITGEKKKLVSCKCTACKKTFDCMYISNIAAEDVTGCRYYTGAPFGFWNSRTNKHVNTYEDTICPECGARVRANHINNVGNTAGYQRNKLLSVHNINDMLTVIGWDSKFHFDKAANEVYEIHPIEAYIVCEKKIVRLSAVERGQTYGSSWIDYKDKWEQRTRYVDFFCGIEKRYIFPWKPKILNGTTSENCKLDKYIKCAGKDTEVFPITYLHLWVKHHNVENLIMQGMGKVINKAISKLKEYSYYYRPNKMLSATNIKGIDWSKVKPHQMLGLTKQEFTEAKNVKLDLMQLMFFQKARSHGVKIKDIEPCSTLSLGRVEDLLKENGCNVMRAVRYCIKQANRYGGNKNNILGDLIDYWHMAKDNGDNLADDSIRYPQNLKNAHDQAMIRKKTEENRGYDRLIKARSEELKKYCYKSEKLGLEIHPAQSTEEFVTEGQLLHHCVATYTRRHAEGSTTLFFIRHSTEPDVPYFTLELDLERVEVRQNRGNHNCGRTDEVAEFENEWLQIVRKIKAKEDKKNGKRNSRNKTAAA